MSEPGVGDFVTPSLQLVRRLGAGGMGTVWVARHLGLNADVVVKFISGHNAAVPDLVARFQREAAAAAEVRSPHVVQMLDHGIAPNGLPYMAMELLEGEDLGARVERLRALPPTEVAAIVAQVCRALSRAHERRIYHRDIKPENIFLCETGEEDAFVKVLDFGIAKVARVEEMGATATGAMLGTPYYMSPEQVVGSKAIDHRTDLWSLGIVAFYALTGARPFEGETLGALVLAICHGELPRPSQYDSRLPQSIDAWFARACARDVAGRFESAKAMSDALVEAVGGKGVVHVRARASTLPHPPGEGAPAPTPPRPRSVAPTLASTTGGASTSIDTPVAGASRRPALLPAILALLLLGLLGGVGFAVTRPGTKAPAGPTSAPANEVRPAAIDSAPRPPVPAPQASPTPSPAPPVASSGATAPIVRPSAPKAPTTATAPAKSPAPKTKPTDEILE